MPRLYLTVLATRHENLGLRKRFLNGVLELVFEWKENVLKINKKSSSVLKTKEKKDGKKSFYKKLRKKKVEEKNYFREIRAKKVRSKIDRQQNGYRQKGQQQNGPCQSGRDIKSCTRRIRLSFIR